MAGTPTHATVNLPVTVQDDALLTQPFARPSSALHGQTRQEAASFVRARTAELGSVCANESRATKARPPPPAPPPPASPPHRPRPPPPSPPPTTPPPPPPPAHPHPPCPPTQDAPSTTRTLPRIRATLCRRVDTASQGGEKPPLRLCSDLRSDGPALGRCRERLTRKRRAALLQPRQPATESGLLEGRWPGELFGLVYGPDRRGQANARGSPWRR